MNSVAEMMENVRSCKCILLYGAGMVGKYVHSCLRAEGYCGEIMFAVSGEPSEEEYCGEKLISIRNVLDQNDSKVILTVMEKKQEDMKQLLAEAGIEKFLYVTDLFFSDLCRKEYIVKDLMDENHILSDQIRNVSRQVAMLTDGMVRHLRKTKLKFEIHLVEHCNLNCKGCDHFSPLAETAYLAPEEMIRDFTRISEITDGQVNQILLLGGEPLLHPNIAEMVTAARTIFPETEIIVVSNGILLLQMTEEFWKACRENQIKIQVTKYSIQIDWNAVLDKADREKVAFSFFNGTGETLKTLWKLPLDEEGKQDPVMNFLECWRANACVILSHGRLFQCPIQSNAYHFSKYFHKKIEVTEHDYVSIYDNLSMQEIEDFLGQPKPFCRFCRVRDEKKGLPWGLSEKSIDEWM